jgi:hypothetical protein
LWSKINAGFECRLKLTLKEINDFFQREGMEADIDFKGVLAKLERLREQQHEQLRLQRQSSAASAEEDRKNALKALDRTLRLVVLDNGVNNMLALEDGSAQAPKNPPHAADDTEPSSKRARHEASGYNDSVGLCNCRWCVFKRSDVSDCSADSGNPDPCKCRWCIYKRSPPTTCSNQTPETPHARSSERPDFMQSDMFHDLMRLTCGLRAIQDAEPSTEDIEERRAAAQKEVERIHLAKSKGEPILLGDAVDARRTDFRRILLLLHPEVRLVSIEDYRAMEALKYALQAFAQSEIASEDSL